MGQLYSGNLEAFHWAKSRLERAGLVVSLSREYRDNFAGEILRRVNIYEAGNCAETLVRKLFADRDIDVLYNKMTGWLTEQAKAYESWK